MYSFRTHNLFALLSGSFFIARSGIPGAGFLLPGIVSELDTTAVIAACKKAPGAVRTLFVIPPRRFRRQEDQESTWQSHGQHRNS